MPVPADGEKTALSVDTLTADPDTSKPLYYWQLYSLLGWEYIEEIVTKFYERVYDDDEDPHFRKAFTQLADLQHHIETQAAYWQDAFGGGKVYHGSHGRLNFHHERNAHQVMNAEGAARWMMHMGLALHDMFPVLKAVDPRIPATIVDFLETKMKKYASQFGWRFNASDFDVAKSIHPDIALMNISNNDNGGDDDKVNSSSSSSKTVYSRREMEGFSIKKLKAVARALKVDISRCREKAEIVEAFVQCERVLVVGRPAALDRLEGCSITDLKVAAKEILCDISHCVEKGDICLAIRSKCGE
jgi:truncated hemoglobin YjbI